MARDLRDILDGCEAELREFGAEAIRAGHYERARHAMGLAERVAALTGADELEQVDGRTPRSGSSKVEPATEKPRGQSKSKTARKASTRARRFGGSTDRYPRYARRGRILVRVGWSKKSNREYEHKASWEAVLAMFEHLRNAVDPDGLWTVEGVSPVSDPTNGGDLPGYQVYLILGWLREVGIIEKHGRDRYAFSAEKTGPDMLERCWSALPAA